MSSSSSSGSGSRAAKRRRRGGRGGSHQANPPPPPPPEERIPRENDIVTLSVGGTKMKTRRSTLCLYKDSLLAQMFATEGSGRRLFAPATTDADGAVFLDFDPEPFRYILNCESRSESTTSKSQGNERRTGSSLSPFLPLCFSFYLLARKFQD